MIYYIGNDLTITNDVDKSTLMDAYNYLKEIPVIGLDIETTRKYNLYPEEGLDPYTSEIVMVQVGDEVNQYIVDYRHLRTLGPLKELLEDEKHQIVGHNLKFEYKHLSVSEGIKINNLYDTMLVEQILYSGFQFKRYSLKEVALHYLKIPVDKTIRLGFLTIGGRPFSKQELQYGADDITIPLRIKKLQLERLLKYDLGNCVRLEMKFISVLGEIELKGMHFDPEQWGKIYAMNVGLANSMKDKLDNWVLDSKGLDQFRESQLDMFDPTIKCNINWNSSHQVIALLTILGICPEEVSKTTGKLSHTVNAAVLKSSLETMNKNTLEENKKLIKDYLVYKELRQRCTTFGEDFLKYINPITGRIHTNYKQILNTGRISSSNPNLQNIPSDEAYRECFTAPEGWKIVNSDYSGQEQIILANKSLAPNLLNFYHKANGDMHSFVASKIFDVSMISILNAKFKKEVGGTLNVSELHLLKKRQLAKGAGFAINYGGTGYTIAKNLGITEKLGNKVYKEYFKVFPGLKRYFEVVQTKTLRTGYILIDNITKRKNFFRPPVNQKESGAIKRAALNFPIQGEAGSITKLAAIMFLKEVKQLNLEDRIFITNLVHDEINVEAELIHAPLAATLLEEAMSDAANYWCKTVPLTAKAVISDHWGH